MSFKKDLRVKILVGSILLFLSSPLFSAGKWNIYISDWIKLSPNKDASIGLVIKKSILEQLELDSSFQSVEAESSNSAVVNDYQSAVQAGRRARADVIIYGSYYIQGESLIISCVAYDVLVKRVKLRKTYTGLVTADIFDTTDKLAHELVKTIKEALPVMTDEGEIEIKKIRQSVYETSAVNIRRGFYTYLGMLSDLGNKNIKWGLDNNSAGSYQGTIPLSTICFGFALRYWDFRINLLLGGISGLPAYDWNNHNVMLQSAPGYLNLALDYYLPWFGNNLAVNAGFIDEDQVDNKDTTNGNVVKTYNFSGNNGNWLSVGLTWNPLNTMELSLKVQPFIANINMPDSQNSNSCVYAYPPFELSGIYFFRDFGIQARLYLAQYKMESWYRNSNSPNFVLRESADSTILGLYFGLVYRVEFLEQK